MQSSQQKIMQFCLKNAIFDGWSTKLLENASVSAGLDANYHRVLFPSGVAGLFQFMTDDINQKMAAEVNLDGLKTTAKVKACLVWRLNYLAPHKAAVKTLLKSMILHPLVVLKASYGAVDAIWRLCGDDSTDFNFYSKRTLLAGVYSSSLLYFLEDNSENHEKTWAFLDARLQEVAKIGKFIGGVKAKFSA